MSGCRHAHIEPTDDGRWCLDCETMLPLAEVQAGVIEPDRIAADSITPDGSITQEVDADPVETPWSWDYEESTIRYYHVFSFDSDFTFEVEAPRTAANDQGMSELVEHLNGLHRAALAAKALLGKYIDLVGYENGVDFIGGELDSPTWVPGLTFTPEEWSELRRIALTGRTPFVMNPALDVEDRGDGTFVVRLEDQEP